MSKLSKNYKPSKKEKFMNSKMNEYFKFKLNNWKKNLLKESTDTLSRLQKEENVTKPDITDRATEEIERSFELRKRDRERKLIVKIDEALKRIENGTYGYSAIKTYGDVIHSFIDDSNYDGLWAPGFEKLDNFNFNIKKRFSNRSIF